MSDKVVVFGSIVLDVVMTPGTLPAPGETVLAPGYSLYPGGKGANQAVAACRAGAKTSFVGAVGRDKFASLANKGLMDAGVNLEGTKQTSEAPTAVACVIVSSTNGENQICVGMGANSTVKVEQLTDAQLEGAGVLLMQMEIPAEENWKAVEKAAALPAVKAVLNVAPFAPVPAEVVAKLDYLIVNELEAQAMCKDYGGGELDPKAAANWIATKYNCTVVATLGADGAVAYAPQPGGAGLHTVRVGALEVEVVDTVGAGDSFVGNFCAALAQGCALEECMKKGAVGGSLACTALGAQSSSPAAELVAEKVTLVTAEIDGN